MLCRRCGMESSTTDVCEWCKRPMLPPGSTVSAQAAKELKESGQPVAVPYDPGQGASGGRLLVQENAEEDAARQVEGSEDHPEAIGADVEAPQLRPLGGVDQQLSAGTSDRPAQPSAGPSDVDQRHSADTSDDSGQPSVEPSAADQDLPAGPSRGPGQPSHGLSDEATRTSVDISQYLGSDQSIFRPIVREDDGRPDGTEDLLRQQARRREAAAASGPRWSENQRLVRCLVAGLVVALVFALAQYLTGQGTKSVIYMSIPLGRGQTLFTAVKFGIASGVIFGFGLGALLVRFQKGPGLGIIAGLLVGLSLQNTYWSVIPGVIVGVICGRIATLGVRRVVNV